MLILKRREGESLTIGEQIEITILSGFTHKARCMSVC